VWLWLRVVSVGYGVAYTLVYNGSVETGWVSWGWYKYLGTGL
jgi:hypothetical protein